MDLVWYWAFDLLRMLNDLSEEHLIPHLYPIYTPFYLSGLYGVVDSILRTTALDDCTLYIDVFHTYSTC